MSLTQAAKEAYARAKIDATELVAVELVHSVFPFSGNAIRIVSHDVAVGVPHESTAPLSPSATVTYQGESITAGWPAQDGNPGSPLTIQINDVDRDIHPHLANAQLAGGAIACNVRYLQFNATTETVMSNLWAVYLEVHNHETTNDLITLVAGYVKAANMEYPPSDYNLITHPALYA